MITEALVLEKKPQGLSTNMPIGPLWTERRVANVKDQLTGARIFQSFPDFQKFLT